jgi:hypothetical protein
MVPPRAVEKMHLYPAPENRDKGALLIDWS